MFFVGKLFQKFLDDVVLELAVEVASDRARAELGIVDFFGDFFEFFGAEFGEGQAVRAGSLGEEFVEFFFENLVEDGALERAEDDLVVDAVEEFGAEKFFGFFEDSFFGQGEIFVRGCARVGESDFCDFAGKFFGAEVEVITMTVDLKSMRRPFESVSFPSSRTWRRMLRTSGEAFSISSRRTTE